MDREGIVKLINSYNSSTNGLGLKHMNSDKAFSFLSNDDKLRSYFLEHFSFQNPGLYSNVMILLKVCGLKEINEEDVPLLREKGSKDFHNGLLFDSNYNLVLQNFNGLMRSYGSSRFSLEDYNSTKLSIKSNVLNQFPDTDIFSVGKFLLGLTGNRDEVTLNLTFGKLKEFPDFDVSSLNDTDNFENIGYNLVSQVQDGFENKNIGLHRDIAEEFGFLRSLGGGYFSTFNGSTKFYGRSKEFGSYDCDLVHNAIASSFLNQSQLYDKLLSENARKVIGRLE